MQRLRTSDFRFFRYFINYENYCIERVCFTLQTSDFRLPLEEQLLVICTWSQTNAISHFFIQNATWVGSQVLKRLTDILFSVLQLLRAVMQPVKMLISVALCALLWSASQVVAPSWYSSAIQPSPSLQATPSGRFFSNLMPCQIYQ